MKIELERIAKLIKAEVIGNKNILIAGIGDITNAKPTDLVFISNSSFLPYLEKTKAKAIIVSANIKKNKEKTLLIVENPLLAYAKISKLFLKKTYQKGIHPTVIIDKTAFISKNVVIGSYVIIGKNVKIEDKVIIFPNVFIGNNTIIGRESIIYSQVGIREDTIIGKKVIIHGGVVLGSDGFRYEKTKNKLIKIPQIGKVIIEDEVEIGANTTIDRATIGATLIKKGTKIDNLVQIAHNVEIGENCILAAQVGIAGSVKIGKNVVIGGQVGIADHISIGDNVIIGARAGVIKNVAENEIISGYPARPHQETMRMLAYVHQLSKLYKQVASLEKKVEKLSS